MIRYLLDTDVVSQVGKPKPNRNVLAWLGSVSDEQLAISVITLRERLEGAEIAKRSGSAAADLIASGVEKLADAYQGRVLPIDEAAARRWAKLLAQDRSRPDDKAQVAVAMSNGLTLVTLNWGDVQGLGAPVLNPSCRPPKLYEARSDRS